MDEKQFKLVINQIAEQAIPETSDPLPVIKAYFRTVDRGPTKTRRFQTIQAIALVGLILVAVLLITPQGRALAQEIIQFFSRSEGETVPLPQQQATAFSQIATPKPTYRMALSTVAPGPSSPLTDLDRLAAQLSGCAQQYQSYSCQAAAVKQMTGYALKGFSSMPQGYVFSKFDIRPQEDMVMTIYRSIEGEGWLVLYQGKGNDSKFLKSSDWTKAPSDKIETVKIGGEQGEYVRGMFVVKAGSSEMTWKDDGWVQKIGWQAGDNWFMIEENNNPIAQSFLDKEHLLAIAGRLVDVQSIVVPTPNPQHLDSVQRVEELAGFRVLQPGLLPEDFKFDFARYEPEWKSVLLYYQGRSGVLIIKQTENKDYILRDLTKTYPTVRKETIRGYEGVYVNHGDNPKPVLWFEEGENILFWKEGDRAMQIIYRPNDFYGGQVGESELVAIGNSLK